MTREAGKGDDMRPTDHKAFSEGVDRIAEWRMPSSLECRECGSDMHTQQHWKYWYCDVCKHSEKRKPT